MWATTVKNFMKYSTKKNKENNNGSPTKLKFVIKYFDFKETNSS